MTRITSLLLCFTLLAAIACGGSDEDEIPLPDLTPFPAEIESRLHEIRDGTAELRGLELPADLEEGIMTREDWRGYLDRAEESVSDSDRVEIEKYSQVNQLLRLIGPEDDILDLLLDLQGEQVAGFYVPSEGTLVLINANSEADIGLRQEYTLSHEYTHSLQQAWYDDERLQELEEDETSEYSTTIDCIHEGDASLTAVLYMNEAHGIGWSDNLEEVEETEEEKEIPGAIRRLFSFNYSECVQFLVSVWAFEGWDGVNELYENPPKTTEQVLHARKYFADELPRDLDLLDIGDDLGGTWEQTIEGTFGEFDVFNYLYTITGEFDEDVVADAAEGWGAGWLSFYTQDDKGLVHISLNWDSPADLEYFRAIYQLGLANLGLDETIETEDQEWRWSDGEERGLVIWTDASDRVDILISTEADPLERAAVTVRSALEGTQ